MFDTIEAPAPAPASERCNGIPRVVAQALVRLTSLEREHSRTPHRLRSPCADLSGEESLQVLEAVERVKGWLDAVSLDAAQRLHQEMTHLGWDLMPDGASRSQITTMLAQTATMTATEIAAATGQGALECARRVSFATADPARTADLAERLRRGETSWHRVDQIHQRTSGCEESDLPTIIDRVLAPRRDGSPCSMPQFRRRLARQITLHDPEAGAQARADALAERYVGLQPYPDGTAALTITGDSARAGAALQRIDAIARRIKAAGLSQHGPGTPAAQARTLANLRSDVALDLILNGQIIAPTTPVTSPEHAMAPPGSAETAPGGDEDLDHAGTALPITTYQAIGELPPASVSVVVSLSTLMGLDERTADLVGTGTISAGQARELAVAGGSTWQRLVTDPLTGTALELTTTQYRPTPGMRRDIIVRDGLCRGVGCTLPAYRCELDHTIAWPTGPTTGTNLTALHHGHHNAKTRRWWRARALPDQVLGWTSPIGRNYTTEPHNYHDPDNEPAPSIPLGNPPY